MIDVQVQYIRSQTMFCLEFPYQSVDKAQHFSLAGPPGARWQCA
jgi:hypothetical protein